MSAASRRCFARCSTGVSRHAGNARPALLAADKARDDTAKIKELYRWVYSRDPDAEELKIALAHLDKHKDNLKVAFEDITWALVNTKEFLFNH